MTNVDQKVDYPVERTGLYKMTNVDQNVAYTVERTGFYKMTNGAGATRRQVAPAQMTPNDEIRRPNDEMTLNDE